MSADDNVLLEFKIADGHATPLDAEEIATELRSLIFIYGNMVAADILRDMLDHLVPVYIEAVEGMMSDFPPTPDEGKKIVH